MQCPCNVSRDPVCGNCGSTYSDDKTYIHLGSTNSNSKISEPIQLPELGAFPFSVGIKMKITRLYHKVTNGKAKRNGPRRATIYCCIIAICKKKQITFDPAQLQKQLDITKKEINKVMKELDPILGHFQVEITMADLLINILKSNNMQIVCLPELLEIHDKCSSKSLILNGSKSETLAAGLAFFYLQKNLPEFDKESYFKLSKVSRDTIVSLSDEFQRCLNP